MCRLIDNMIKKTLIFIIKYKQEMYVPFYKFSESEFSF